MKSFNTSDRIALGLIGGAGPLVAAHLHHALLRHFQAQTGARADHEFPAILVLNQALAGVDELGVSDPALAQDALAHQVTGLRTLGANAWMMACASLHSLPAAQAPDCIAWLSDAAADLKRRGIDRVGIVGSSSSRRDRIFEDACRSNGLTPVLTVPSSQPVIDALIEQGMTGVYREEDRQMMLGVEAEISPQCDLIWWGCTELSFLPSDWFTHPALQSMDAMIKSILSRLLVSS